MSIIGVWLGSEKAPDFENNDLWGVNKSCFFSYIMPKPPPDTDTGGNPLKEFFFVQTWSAQCLWSKVPEIQAVI